MGSKPSPAAAGVIAFGNGDGLKRRLGLRHSITPCRRDAAPFAPRTSFIERKRSAFPSAASIHARQGRPDLRSSLTFGERALAAAPSYGSQLLPSDVSPGRDTVPSAASRSGAPVGPVPRPGRSGRPPRASSGAWPASAPLRLRRFVCLRAAPNGPSRRGNALAQRCRVVRSPVAGARVTTDPNELSAVPARRSGSRSRRRAPLVLRPAVGERTRTRAAEHSRSATGIHIRGRLPNGPMPSVAPLT
jgi:hypothetical protein